MDTETSPSPGPLFRSAKRRKFIRRRPDDSTEEHPLAREAVATTSGNTSRPSEAIHADDSQENPGVVRLRRPHATRKGGIEFSATSRPKSGGGQQPTLLSAEDAEKARVQAMCDRFTSDIGQTEDVDKHMMAYIDSEMAKRFQRNPPPDHPAVNLTATTQNTRSASTAGQQEREPASLGKLHEIDLGQEAKLRNIARTEAATRRLVGEEGPNTSGIETQPSRPTTDKSWRKSKRRTSADIERDRLVEEVMRESKLDVYDEPEEDEFGDDQAADDRIAEQFRRDFMDAMQSRKRVARPTRTDKTRSFQGSQTGRKSQRKSSNAGDAGQSGTEMTRILPPFSRFGLYHLYLPVAGTVLAVTKVVRT
ncbi:hypothetical protein N7468_010489 [Penicillium chermesinum]|uniref:Hepatocellular carcinoma-associated antigen 59-domain-containing protein n=1 Tax=Penicillium chermesinum TaxID=63820 RepID=A0A9W9N7R0_9EURO|nr:uncharacterized protein N7468_010489 [Penicillium chermesinum]KAJ5214810.1 hypothetical protein N7468_010489 [Penicillium chermesinum]